MRTLTLPDNCVQGVQVGPIPWPEFETEILGLYEPPRVSAGHREKMKRIFKSLRALGIQTTADLTPPMVARLVNARPPGQSDWTLQSILMCFRAACTYAERMGYVRISPFRVLKISHWVKPEPLSDKRHLTREELRRLLDLLAADVAASSGWREWRCRRLQVAVAIMAYCGLRRNECLRLEVGDIDLESGIISVVPHAKRLKNSASRNIVPMPDALIPLVADWLKHRLDSPEGYPLPDHCPWLIPRTNRGGPWLCGESPYSPLGRFRAVAKRAGIENATFHSLRRSLATHLEFYGAGEAAIGRILRHAPGSVVTKQFYRRDDAANLRAIVARVDF